MNCESGQWRLESPGVLLALLVRRVRSRVVLAPRPCSWQGPRDDLVSRTHRPVWARIRRKVAFRATRARFGFSFIRERQLESRPIDIRRGGSDKLSAAGLISFVHQMSPLTSENAVLHVIDDASSIGGGLEGKGLLDSVGIDAQTYRTANDFLAARIPDRPGCMVFDSRLPDLIGLDLQGKLINIGVQLAVVMMRGHGHIVMTAKAVKRVAMDFLAKPFRDRDMLDAAMAAFERHRQRRAAPVDVSPIVARFRTFLLVNKG